MTPVQIHLAALLWVAGHDTTDIATCLGLCPADIYNSIDAIKAEAGILRGKDAA